MLLLIIPHSLMPVVIQQANINLLPNELVFEIFRHIDPKLIKKLNKKNLNKIENIFDLYKYFSKEDFYAIESFRLTCRLFNNAGVYLINKFKDKVKNLQELAIKKHKSNNIKQLNEKLKNMLDFDNINLRKCYKITLAKSDINIQNKFGDTLLIWAAINNNVDIIRLLLKNKHININIKNEDGDTALTWAVFNNDIKISKLLIARKDIDINLQDSDGNTALILATINNNAKIINLIFGKDNVDISIQNKNNETALDIAKQSNNTEIIALINAYHLK